MKYTGKGKKHTTLRNEARVEETALKLSANGGRKKLKQGKEVKNERKSKFIKYKEIRKE